MLVAVLSGFILAIFAPTIKRFLGYRAGWVLALLPASIFIYFLSLYDQVMTQRAVFELYEWVPTLGINLSFYLDGISLMFALLISGIGTFIMISSGGYLKGHVNQGRFFAFMLMFMASMLGVVLASNLIAIFFFWEMTSVTSFLLIGFDHLRKAARRAAFQALVVTGLGGLGMLGGFIILGVSVGNFELVEIMQFGTEIKDLDLYFVILVLVLLGAFTKSAQFPFHFWLPNAMEAPTPVSAFLHSATMVKAGVYLLMRMYPILGDTIEWSVILGTFGAFTLLSGTFIAIRQTDLKRMLAYTTMASLGLLVMLIGVGGEGAIEGAVLYLFAHSLFKGGLFTVAGTIDHEAGTRDITKLGGLRSKMPITFFAALIAALSMGGIIPLVGFIAKESMYHALLHGNNYTLILLAVAIIGNAFMFAIGFAVALKPMLGKLGDMPKAAHEAPIMLWIGALVLGICGLAAGFGITYLGSTLIHSAVSSINNENASTELHLWAGINMPLILSLFTMGLGAIIYMNYHRVRIFADDVLNWIGWGPDKGFDQFFAGLLAIAQWVTRNMQNGDLKTYMRYIFIMLALVIWVPMFIYGAFPSIDLTKLVTPTFYEAGILLMAVLGLYAVLVAKSRLTSIVSLGILGFSVALLFMLFGAPDLSFTQFMVETLSVVILALVMTRLKLDKSDRKYGLYAIISAIIATAVGTGMTLLLLRVMQTELDMSLSNYFTKYSAAIAHGHNIVNVILVDFRALDTLGEISVVMTTGIVVLALIRLKPKVDNNKDQNEDNLKGSVK
ncbi:MAG: putative monovalent cation/H+ antiporter subunit A [Rhizobiales bacterium]|nr:putative monovalent cation/H+ antiporter subunit A [Hyphomicrobiales bacterium]